MINLLDSDALWSFPGVTFEPGNIPDCVTGIHPKLSDSAEFEFECEINGDLFAKLTGVDMAIGKDFTVTYDTPTLIQRKRHKKKRINKKWRKRYGYITRFESMSIKDCQITHRCEFGNDILSVSGREILGI